MSIISTRRHEIIEARERQLRLNELAVHGGRPYIAARLWRAPNETDVSWDGDPARGVAGRRERACLVNDAGRIARKIEQYIFKAPARRDGADEAFCADCTGTGEGIHEFMRGVCTAVTYGGWCWVQVDRAPFAVGEDGARVEPSLAERTPVRLVRWTRWTCRTGGSTRTARSRGSSRARRSTTTPTRARLRVAAWSRRSTSAWTGAST